MTSPNGGAALLFLASLLLVGCAVEKEYVVSEPISGGLSKSAYDIDCSSEIVTYKRRDA